VFHHSIATPIDAIIMLNIDKEEVDVAIPIASNVITIQTFL
jgi:hypothetical protein